MTAGRLPRVLELRPIAAVMDFARDWIAHTAPLPDRARDVLLSDDDHQLLEPIEGGVARVSGVKSSEDVLIAQAGIAALGL